MAIRRGIHNDITGRNVDTPISWQYANKAGRLAASGFKPIDVGRYAWQADNNTIWMLTDDSPITWKQVGGNPVASQDSATFGDELLTNGTFDSDASGWTYQATPTGTVTTTGSDVNVTGSGTNFLSCFRDGDSIKIEAETKTISRVVSNTLIKTTTNFGAHTDQAFEVVGGWSYDAGNKRMAHTAGNSVPLSQVVNGLTKDYIYRVLYNVPTLTAGSITAVRLSNSPGGSKVTPVSYAYNNINASFQAEGTSLTLEFVTTATFAGSLDSISMKRVIPNESPAFLVESAGGEITTEIRPSPPGKKDILFGKDAGKHSFLGGFYTIGNLSSDNVVIGGDSFPIMTDGYINTGIGFGIGPKFLNGQGNIGIGPNAFYRLVSGNFNIMLGYFTGQQIVNGQYNIGIGLVASSNIGNASNNVGIGYGAIYSNYMGDENVAIGSRALYSDFGGEKNVAIGSYALYDVSATSKGIMTFDDYSTTVPGTVKCTSNAHGLSTNDVVTIFGSLYYDGTYTITKIDNNNFYIDCFFVRKIDLASTHGMNGTHMRWRLTTRLGSKNIGIGSHAGRGITYGSGNTIIGADITGLAADTTNNVILGSGGAIRLRFDGTKWLLTDLDIALGTTTGTKIGTATNQKLGFFNATPIVQPAALTAQLTTITHTAPGTPDYAIQDFTQSSPWGFASQDEANSVLAVIANLQTRVSELETKLKALGLVA